MTRRPFDRLELLLSRFESVRVGANRLEPVHYKLSMSFIKDGEETKVVPRVPHDLYFVGNDPFLEMLPR
jgi:hypothetical protein